MILGKHKLTSSLVKQTKQRQENQFDKAKTDK